MIVRGRHLLAEPGDGWIDGGAVLVAGDEIAAVGTYEELAAAHPGEETLGSDRHLVIPGLVNAHYHGEGLSTVQRGLADGLLEPWLAGYWARIGAIDAYLDTLWCDLKLVRSGVTSGLHMAYHRGSGDPRQEAYDSLRAHRDAGLRVAFSPQARDRNAYVYEDDDAFKATLPADLRGRLEAAEAALPPWTADDALALLDELARETAGDPRVRILASGSGPQWCSDELLLRLHDAAGRLGTGLHFHALESPYQREWARRAYGRDTLEHLRELGVLGPIVSVAHAVWLTDVEIDVLAETGTAICHNASSNLRLHCGIAPLTRLLERGVTVGLGIDGMGLGDDDDMLAELRVVEALHRLPRGLEPRWRPRAADVVRLATAGGAAVTGFPVGRLAAGTKADIVLLDLDALAGPWLHPGTPLEEALVQRGRAAHVDTVVVGGEVVLAGGRSTRVDEEEIAARLAEAAAATAPPPAVLDELRPAIERWFEGWAEPAFRPRYLVNSSS